MSTNETPDEATKGKVRIYRPMRAIRVTRKGWLFVNEQKVRRLAARFEAQCKARRESK